MHKHIPFTQKLSTGDDCAIPMWHRPSNKTPSMRHEKKPPYKLLVRAVQDSQSMIGIGYYCILSCPPEVEGNITTAEETIYFEHKT